MLCPKCGYITFDQYEACPECKKDWESVKGKFSGTLAIGAPQCFLSSVLKGNEAESDVETASAESASYPEGEGITLGIDEETGDIPGVEFIEPESPGENDDDAEEEKDELELALNDLPEIDLSAAVEAEEGELGADSAEDVEKEADAGSAIEMQIDSADVQATEEEQRVEPAEEAKADEAGIEFEMPPVEDVSLEEETTQESPDESAQPIAAEKEDEPGGLSLDLKDIDMSDLVSQEEEVDGVVGLDLGETDVASIDLDMSESEPEQSSDALPGIDLNLDDEDDVLDLSLDLDLGSDEPEEEREEPKIPDLGLSLDLDD